MLLFLTSYAIREILLFSTLFLGLAGLLLWLAPPAAILPLAGLAFTLNFFRDPRRRVPDDPHLLVSPADGTVTDILDIQDPDLGDCTQIGIFLSVFDVHINRTPAAGTIRDIRYVPGKFHDARDPRATRENESNRILIDTVDDGPLAIRQISGAIARRIVFPFNRGDRVARGQKFGMIKFGSRTELLVPRARLAEILVRPQDKVRGGETILARTRHETLAIR